MMLGELLPLQQLYIGATSSVSYTKKARLKIEHRGMKTFEPFQRPCFSSVVPLLAFRRGKKRERALNYKGHVSFSYIFSILHNLKAEVARGEKVPSHFRLL